MSDKNATPEQVLGLGLDLAEVSRVEASLQRFGLSFAQRICTEGEVSRWELAGSSPAALAAGFAAKEACLKALGTGWAQGVTFRQVEILTSPGSGRREIIMHGVALRRAAEMGVERTMLSISQNADVAAALVILVGSLPARP